MEYQIFIHREAIKKLKKLDEQTVQRIKGDLILLKKDPYHCRSGVDIKKLIGTNPVLYRLRVGDYRVIYSVDNNCIWITDIFHRKKGYI